MKIILILLFGFIFSLQAQDDLLGLIDEIATEPTPVIATFKATRIVNAQSVELVRPKTTEFMIQHRFGSMKNGLYDLMGMDNATIRFDLKYGLNPYMSLGVGRSSLNKTYDFFTKIKFAQQSDEFPISVALFLKSEIQTLSRNSDFSHELVNRITYDSQFLLAKKLNSKVSIQLMPTWIHHNWVRTHEDDHDLFSLGMGGRFKLSNRVSVNGDTFFPMGTRDSTFIQSWGVGCDIETGGHVFQIMVTNVQGAFESAYVENASGKIEGMDLYLGFNITRVFSI